MVVYGPEDLLRRNNQVQHLPQGHLKVHLRKLEQALEEARHADALIAARGRGAAKVGGGARRSRQRYVRVHGGQQFACTGELLEWHVMSSQRANARRWWLRPGSA